MTLKMLVALSMVSLALSGCREEKRPVEEVYDLVKRCLTFVDTMDFPSRGLYSVNGTAPIQTRDDRGAQLRVEYAGLDENNLFCAVTNLGVAWSKPDRDKVFEAIAVSAPAWVARKNNIQKKNVKIVETSDGVFKRHVLYRSSRDGKAFLAIHEGRENGFVTVLTGRGGILE